MTPTEVIKIGLEQSQQWLTALTGDMQDALTTAPTSSGGNNPHWVAGHVILAEATLVAGFIQGKENPLARWNSMFGTGSEPDPDAKGYPSFDALMAEFRKVRSNTLDVLASLTEGDLGKASHAPEDLAAMFGTIGQCLVMIGLHTAFHAGQVADARRAAGKKPMFG